MTSVTTWMEKILTALVGLVHADTSTVDPSNIKPAALYS